MVEYSRSTVSKMGSAFVIEPFSKEKKGEKRQKASMIDTLNIGMYIVAPLICGVLLGLFLDGKFHSKPVCVLTGIVLGVAGSFFNLFKLVSQISKHA